LTVYKDVDMKPVLKGREIRRTRMEASEAKSLRFSHLIYISGGIKVVKVYTDKYGAGWIWDEKQKCFLKASVYLPMNAILKREDGEV